MIEGIGRRGWTRTSDHLLRRQVLYPPELRALVFYKFTPAVRCSRRVSAQRAEVAQKGIKIAHPSVRCAGKKSGPERIGVEEEDGGSEGVREILEIRTANPF